MRIYRVEHKDDELGPYRKWQDQLRSKPKRLGIFSFHKRADCHGDINIYPTPLYDIDRLVEKEEICGFSTKKQLTDWFSIDELRYLIKNGYRIRIYETREYTEGRRQTIFYKPLAVKLFPYASSRTTKQSEC